MKTKFLCTALVTLFSTALLAQEMTVTANKTTFGLRGGVNFQNINGKNGSGDKLENELMTGFHAGVTADIPVGTGSYLQPGVLYSLKGAKLHGSDTKVKIAYVEVPVNFVYKPLLGTGNMLLGFGPYVAFGIGGKVDNANGADTDIEFKNTYSTPTPNMYEFKRIDGGANFLAGYEFANKLSFQLNAQLGLTDINPKSSNNSGDKTNLRNTGWGLSVGYKF